MKEIFDPVIQRNSLFDRSENILIAMITDDTEHVRELELRRILKACPYFNNKISATIQTSALPILKFCVRRLRGNE